MQESGNRNQYLITFLNQQNSHQNTKTLKCTKTLVNVGAFVFSWQKK